MSHVASVDCIVTDLSVARAVGLRLGFELMEGQSTFKAYYPKQACEHAFRLIDRQADDYEIGLLPVTVTPNGVVPRTGPGVGWQLAYDPFYTYGERLHAKAGVGLMTLSNELAAEATLRTLQREGYRVRRTVTAEGDIDLVAER